MTDKDIVVGLGEIGKPILKIISKHATVVGYDVNSSLMNTKKFDRMQQYPVRFLHVCIPFTKNFQKHVSDLSDKFNPKGIIIHSTIQPYTTKSIQSSIDIPVIYSATRGIHKRMIYDMKRYTKFFAIEKKAPKRNWAAKSYSKLMRESGIKTKQMSDPVTLELAKIVVDTSYYGWLINYAQLSNMIAIEHNVNYDEMWSFSDEINKFVGNRPKLFPGFIGGHCVIPNLDLMHNRTLDLIKEINDSYLKKVPNAKSINKKYDKSKKQSYST